MSKQISLIQSTALNKKRLLSCVGSADLWEKLHLTTHTYIYTSTLEIVCERVLGEPKTVRSLFIAMEARWFYTKDTKQSVTKQIQIKLEKKQTQIERVL